MLTTCLSFVTTGDSVQIWPPMIPPLQESTHHSSHQVEIISPLLVFGLPDHLLWSPACGRSDSVTALSLAHDSVSPLGTWPLSCMVGQTLLLEKEAVLRGPQGVVPLGKVGRGGGEPKCAS